MVKFAGFCTRLVLSWILLLTSSVLCLGQSPSDFPADVAQLFQRYCAECHSNKTDEGNLSFEAWGTTSEAEREKKLAQVLRVLKLEEMPPEGSTKPSAHEIAMIQKWSQGVLDRAAQQMANDPGPIVLRRLSNSEYTYTLRDLTGLQTLEPTKEFPVDNVAGEGFTNAGAAMVMSPALFNKYFDAAKSLSQKMVLLPDGIDFSESTSPNDWATERLNRIRQLYARYTDSKGANRVNLQGVQFETNQGGRNPFDRYLDLLFRNEDALAKGTKSLTDLGKEINGSQRYLNLLAEHLSIAHQNRTISKSNDKASPLLHELRAQWKQAREKQSSEDVAKWIGKWQEKLWKFSAVGHIGKLNGPKAWQEPVDPISHQLSIKQKLSPKTDTILIDVYNAGDGQEGDNIDLLSPRFSRSGEPDLPLIDALRLAENWKSLSVEMRATAQKALAVAARLEAPADQDQLQELAKSENLSEASLELWLELLGLRKSDESSKDKIGEVLFEKSASNLAGHSFIQGWVAEDALSIVSNSSETEVRIPGVMTPKSVAVHPSPTRSVGIGWTANQSGRIKIDAAIQHAHPECGNGVVWLLEVKRGHARIGLATGNSAGGTPVLIGPFQDVSILAGDEVRLLVGPRDGNHSCDLTRVDMTIHLGDQKWKLSESLSSKLIQSNPLDDFAETHWRFFHAPAQNWGTRLIPPSSILSQWFLRSDAESKTEISAKLQQILKNDNVSNTLSPADEQLLRLFSNAVQWLRFKNSSEDPKSVHLESSVGALLLHRDRMELAKVGWIKIPVPEFFRNEWEFVAEARLLPGQDNNGSVQLSVQEMSNDSAESLERDRSGLIHAPVLVHPSGEKEKEYQAAFEDFRNTFPIALCYPQIVPVDEVVTLTLYHREDRFLKELMLNDAERAELEKLWNELHFVSQDALRSVDVFEQLWQYATQDADPSAFEPLREPIQKRAARFKDELVRAEGHQLRGVLEFAAKAYRRELRPAEADKLRQLYTGFREQGLAHDAAIRGVMVRILIAPEFLYRLESPASTKSKQGPVSADELATRLSYFLWSSAPDETLRRLAKDGSLFEESILREQVRRMLEDPKSSRMAAAFFGQWLQIANVSELDEKSEKEFPEFVSLRGRFQNEANQFFEYLVRKNRPPMELLTADYLFADSELAKFYGIPDSELTARTAENPMNRFDQATKWNRGGVLTLGALLSKLSGASRTSPILRGTWVSEVLLGEPLPKPPKNVPQLPDSVPENLSERQLTELHVSAPGCSNCHRRIDPFGFAMESFDAIGRYRTADRSGHAVDSTTNLPDGTTVSGHRELRDYLVRARSKEFLLQFHRKLLGYALGREVMLSDKLYLESLVQKASTDSLYGIGDAVEAIVMSRPFREIRSEEEVKP